MTRARLIIIAGLILALAGCTLQGGSKTVKTPVAPQPAVVAAPAPPPEPLSIPQTQVVLPKPQPFDKAALETTPPPPPPVEPAAPAPKTPPVGKPRLAAPPPRPEPAGPPAAAPEELPRISEIVPADEFKKLKEQAQVRRLEATAIVTEVAKRPRLTAAQRGVVDSINSFVTASLDAEKRNDIRQADSLAEKAQVLAKGLRDGQ